MAVLLESVQRRLIASGSQLDVVAERVFAMIKPRGTKTNPRKPKVDTPAALPKRLRKNGVKQALVKHANPSGRTSEAGDVIGVNRSDEPQLIPPALAGRWIAWSADGLRIVGSGVSLVDAEQAASQVGETDPIFERAAGTVRR